MIRTLALRPAVTRAAASGLLLATEVADYLVGARPAVPVRPRGHRPDRADLYEAGKDFSAMTLADWRRYHDLFEEEVLRVVTPEAAVSAKRTPQSTNPQAVANARAELERWLAERGRGN